MSNKNDPRLLSTEEEAACRAFIANPNTNERVVMEGIGSVWDRCKRDPLTALFAHLDAISEEHARYRDAILALNQAANAGANAGCGWCEMGLAWAQSALDPTVPA